MTFEMAFNLALGFGEKAEVPLAAEQTRRGTERKRTRIPQRIKQTRAAAEFVDALRGPRKVIGFFGGSPFERGARFRVTRGQRLPLIQRLCADFAGVID